MEKVDVFFNDPRSTSTFLKIFFSLAHERDYKQQCAILFTYCHENNFNLLGMCIHTKITT